jgi:hypothetical protein
VCQLIFVVGACHVVSTCSIMKPVSATDILRRSAPREFLGSSFNHRNRFEIFREPSPAPTIRNRLGSSASTKRKGNDMCEGDFCEEAPPKKSNISSWFEDSIQDNQVTINLTEEEEVNLACLESNIAKVSGQCNKMLVELQRLHIEEPLRVILADLIEAVTTTNKVQEGLSARVRANTTLSKKTSQSYGNVAAAPPPASQPAEQKGKENVKSNNRKKLSGGLFAAQTDDRGKFAGSGSSVIIPAKKVETEEEKRVRKFNEAIRDAERSTLCFNLNMGNKPIMNKATIAEKATLALTTMAAQVEGKNRTVPSQEVIAVIDDVTSLVTNMEFYGSNTKQYKGKEGEKDPPPPFCTVPVKYQFKDREQRVFAEKQLRETCKVKCATPYPAIVRECIKQVVDHVRVSHPDDFVKVNVHAKDFALKVYRRPKGNNLPWIEYPDLLRLPNEAWDVTQKKVPKGLKMFYLPSESDADEDMQQSSQDQERPPSPCTK